MGMWSSQGCMRHTVCTTWYDSWVEWVQGCLLNSPMGTLMHYGMSPA